MSSGSIFAQMLRGQRPARLVWADDQVVALLSDTPLNPGHTLVVPRREVDYWIDLEPALLQQVMRAAQEVAKAIQLTFRPPKVGVLIAGIEVRHVHLHLVPISSARDFNFERQNTAPDPADLDAAATGIRAALRDLGHSATVPE